MKKPRINITDEDMEKLGEPISQFSIVKFKDAVIVTGDMEKEDIVKVFIQSLRDMDLIGQCISRAVSELRMEKLKELIKDDCQCEDCVMRRELFTRQRTEN